MSLTNELTDLAKNSAERVTEEVRKEMMAAHQALIHNKIDELAIKEGAVFPNFKLSNAKGINVELKDLLLKNKYTIISFYRGGWCPYCNLELKALQNKLSDFNKSGAGLVAITPETPDHSLSTSEKNNLSFEVLTDLNSKLSKEINIAFDLPENLKPIYENFGIDVKKHNGNFILPIPATFIVDNNGKILFRYVDIDYKKRLDPEEIIKFLNH